MAERLVDPWLAGWQHLQRRMNEPPAPIESRPRRSFLDGGGELGALMRAYDWSQTPLGPSETWPQALKTAVRILLTSRQPFWLGWGPDLTYLYNDPYKAIIGGKHPEALGRPFREVWSEIWSVVGPMADGVMRRDEGTYVEAQLLIMERHGYQEETYYTFSYSPIPDDDGQPGGLICANTDDTRRVIGERQLATLRDVAARALPAMSVAEVQRHAVEALGTNQRDLPFCILFHGEDVVAASPGTEHLHSAALWAHGTSYGSLTLVELDERRHGEVPTGAWDRMPHRAAVLSLDDGFLVVGLNPFRQFDQAFADFLELLRSQLVSRIANAKAYQEELQRSEALAELDRAKTTFFSNVSHELRTPLTLILAPLEDALAAKEQLSPELQGQLDVAQRNALRLLKLVNTLLDFARLEAGRIDSSYEEVDLGALTSELTSVFRSAIERAGIALSVEVRPLAGRVWVDRDMWEKIVLNLLSNAFKFTLEGRIEVAVEGDASHAIVTVRDTGSGIPESELGHVFERFHRVKGARGRSFEGTGIGLALVAELVRLHGGDVSVESSVGRGSSFRVRIPYGDAHLPKDRIEARRSLPSSGRRAEAYVLDWLQPERTTPEPPQDERSARILLADDNADMRDYVAHLLSSQYQVSAVANGAEALEAARQNRPDLVISDVMMPELDGFGLLGALRADPDLQTVPVMLLSARAGEEARIEGIAATANDYLVKPFSARELRARVAACLVKQRGEERFRRIFDTAAASILDLDLSALESWVRELRAGGVANLTAYARENPSLSGEVVQRVCVHDVNESAVRLFRASSKSVLLDSFQKLTTTESLATFLEGVEALARGATQFEREVPVTLLDGERRDVWLGLSRSKNDHTLTSVLVTLLDVSARKRAEAHLSLTTSAARIGTWQWTVPTGELEWSAIHKEMWGYEPEATMAYADWLERIDPKQREQADACVRRSLAGEGRYDNEYRIVPLGASAPRWIRSIGEVVFGHDGSPLLMQGVSLDVTDQKRAEEAAREEAHTLELLNNVGLSLAGKLELEPILQTVTDTATQLSGAEFGAFFYNVTNESGESYLLYTLSGAPRAAFERFGLPRNTPIFAPTFAGQGVVRLDDVKQDPRYGQMAPHHGMPAGHLPVTSYLAAPVVSRTGEVIGGLFFGHSEPARFTERAERLVTGIAAQAAVAIDNARLYGERERLIDELKTTDRRKDEFLATLAHELRNPLAPLKNSVELMRASGHRDPMVVRLEDTIERQVTHLVRLVDDLLDMSRISRGVLELKKRHVTLRSVVEAAVETSDSMIRSGKHELSVRLPDDDVWLDGDPVRLAQIFSNLLNNAALYTSPGGKIDVVVEHAEHGVSVRVRDNGEGISQAALARIFDMFDRGERASGHGPSGLGIGLALARQLVELHGGTITALSGGSGKGSEFVVTLPVASTVGQSTRPEQAPNRDLSTRILVVDDNPDSTETLSMLLQMLGADTHVAHDGAQAIAEYSTSDPRVVLLDIGLPDMDGYEVVRRLKAQFPDRKTTFIALTGWGQEDDRRKAREAGFDHHFTKPVDMTALRSLLASLGL